MFNYVQLEEGRPTVPCPRGPHRYRGENTN